MGVQVLQLVDDKPTWVGGYTFLSSADGMTRVKHAVEGSLSEWTHDRVRPDTTPIRFY